MEQAAGEASAFLPTLTELIALRGRLAHGLVRPGRALAPAAGGHRSPYLGRGMTFAGVRPYQPGDDVRSLDWRHTARHGRPYTKLFEEERERPVLLFADLGPSMHFGSRVAFKSVAAARATALLAWAAIAAGDRVGGVIRGAAGHRVIRPEGRERGALAIVRQLTAHAGPAVHPAPSLLEPIRALARLTRPGTRVVLASDFFALDVAAEQEFARLARHAQLTLVHVFDLLEAAPPPAGVYRLTDGVREQLLDLRHAGARAAYGQPFRDRQGRLAALARRTGARLIELATHDDPLEALPALFEARPVSQGGSAGAEG